MKKKPETSWNGYSRCLLIITIELHLLQDDGCGNHTENDEEWPGFGRGITELLEFRNPTACWWTETFETDSFEIHCVMEKKYHLNEKKRFCSGDIVEKSP